MTQPGKSRRFGLRPTRTLIGLSLAVGCLFPSQASASPPMGPTIAASLLGQTEYGTIKGRLVWGGDKAPAPAVLAQVGKAATNPEVCAKNAPILQRALVVDPKTKGVANAFAYLVRPKGSNPEAVKELVAKHPEVVLDQKNCEFEPYVLPMHQDQPLVIKSSDPIINHNVRMSAFSNPGKNQMLAPGAKLALNLVAERNPIEMSCDIHPWMKSYVMVFDHPFFATTATDGSFEIKGVPVGPQKLILRLGKSGYVTPGQGAGMPIEVKAGGVTDVGEIKVDPSKAKF